MSLAAFTLCWYPCKPWLRIVAWSTVTSAIIFFRGKMIIVRTCCTLNLLMSRLVASGMRCLWVTATTLWILLILNVLLLLRHSHLLVHVVAQIGRPPAVILLLLHLWLLELFMVEFSQSSLPDIIVILGIRIILNHLAQCHKLWIIYFY